MKKLMIMTLGCVLATGAFADSKPFQLSLTPDTAMHPRDTSIEGVSLGVWNENPGKQWQLGFINGSTGDSAGVQWFVLLPTIYNYAETFTGAQIGLVNYADDVTGLQWGAVNIAKEMTGLQLGLVNWAESADSGVQIGLVNVIEDNEWFSDFPSDLSKGMVIVNWSFGE